VACILQILSCAGGRLPSTSQVSYSERIEAVNCGGMYLSEILHKTVAEGRAIRGNVTENDVPPK